MYMMIDYTPATQGLCSPTCRALGTLSAWCIAHTALFVDASIGWIWLEALLLLPRAVLAGVCHCLLSLGFVLRGTASFARFTVVLMV